MKQETIGQDAMAFPRLLPDAKEGERVLLGGHQPNQPSAMFLRAGLPNEPSRARAYCGAGYPPAPERGKSGSEFR